MARRTGVAQLPLSSAVFTVEANPERGEVEVFSTDRVTADDFKETFAAIIEKTTYSLEKQEEEVAVGNEDSGVRAVLGAGGQVVEILMPNQSRKVFIHQPADGATEESIRQKFEQFGTIIDCKKLHGMDVWGYVIFGSSGEAAEAVERTKADDRDKGQLEKPRRAKQNSALKARLSWFRRPCTGNAYVTVTSPDFFLKCTKMGVLQVAGTTVKIEEDTVKKNRLLLTGLPHEITDGLIKESLLIAGKETDERIVTFINILRTRAVEARKTTW
ncbi:hypothetical protein BaRGS_00023362 [Batillaria attramentaria]|uniref:RRM domain-containing protein n=1 Tax=Batillaria attramentaria TaxID=370345 RepID=A0ABD0KE59_9CAEN